VAGAVVNCPGHVSHDAAAAVLGRRHDGAQVSVDLRLCPFEQLGQDLVDAGDDVRGQPERELGGVSDYARQSAEALPETGGGEGQDRNGLLPPAAAVADERARRLSRSHAPPASRTTSAGYVSPSSRHRGPALLRGLVHNSVHGTCRRPLP